MSHLLEPAYDARSIGDVLPAVCAALGVDAGFDDPGLALPSADAYVVFLVDGLGLDLLTAHPGEAPVLVEAVGEAWLTAGVPSTTATSLTSLGTGLHPGRHGVVGFTSRIPGTDELLNALFWDDRVDPDAYQPHPTAFERLRAAGAGATVVNKRSFARSGLTRSGQRGASYVGADSVGEQIAGAVAASRTRPSVTYLYDADLDATGHRHGVDSAAWRAQLSHIDATVEEVREALPTDVRLLVVADHGMVDCPDERRIDIDEHPALRDGVALLGGEARFRHVYCRSGAVGTVAAAWRETLADRAVVLTREEAEERGWFGVVEGAVRPRLGDVVAAACDDWALMSSADFSYEQSLIGMHGSLTPAEMRIPLLVL